MIVSQGELRSRIDQMRLSHDGYGRQLARLGLSEERRARVENEVALLGEELATLEKLNGLMRLEPDLGQIEKAVRERLAEVRARLASDPNWAALSDEERDSSTGEIGALLWALREDAMSVNMTMLMEGYTRSDPGRTDRALPQILIHTLEEGPSLEARAGAAYDLGKMRVTAAIPALAAALDADPFISEMALHALCAFSDEELAAAGVTGALLEKVARSRET